MKSQIFKSPLPYLALLIAHVIWGINFVVAKVTLNEVPPMSLAFARFFLAALLMVPFLLTLEKNKRSIKLKHLLTVFTVGLLMVTFNIAFFYEGLKRTTAINSSVLMLIIPVLSVLGSWIFLKEKIYLINFLGVLAGLIGALVVIGIPLLIFGNFVIEDFVGNSLIIASATAFTAGSVMSKKILTLYSPLLITAAMFLVGAITFAIPAGFEYLRAPTWVNHVTILGLLGLLFITLLSTVSAYFLLVWGLSKVGVIQANLVQYLEPAVAATIAVPFLGERISYSFIVGTCLIVLGVYWGTLGKQEHHHAHFKSHRI